MCISNLDSGGRKLEDEYGKVDDMTPVSGIIDHNFMVVAIYFTKPPSREGWNSQEIHLIKFIRPPADMLRAFVGRS